LDAISDLVSSSGDVLPMPAGPGKGRVKKVSSGKASSKVREIEEGAGHGPAQNSRPLRKKKDPSRPEKAARAGDAARRVSKKPRNDVSKISKDELVNESVGGSEAQVLAEAVVDRDANEAVLSAGLQGRHGTNWQLEAVRQVRLRMGKGFRRGAAQIEVAAFLNKTIDDLQTWERELVKVSELENDLLCCELAGEFYDYLVSGHYTNVPRFKSYGTFAGEPNIARAARIVREMRRISLSEIRGGLRTRRRLGERRFFPEG
jgi:hypothetical protein